MAGDIELVDWRTGRPKFSNPARLRMIVMTVDYMMGRKIIFRWHLRF